METTQFILEGYCQGSYPVEGYEDIVDEEWYKDVVDLIKNGNHSAALAIAREHFTAEYNTQDIAVFDESGISYVRTLSVNLNLPFIENDGENDIALFKWIGAHFLMEGPADVVESWIETNERGLKIFSQDKFENWFGDDNSLQDGCCYNLGACWYDLEGFGENGCTVYGESVVLGLEGSLDKVLGNLVTAADRRQMIQEELLKRLPSQTPLIGDELRLIAALLEEESPAGERRPDRNSVVEKWASLSGYSKSSDFLGALLAL